MEKLYPRVDILPKNAIKLILIILLLPSLAYAQTELRLTANMRSFESPIITHPSGIVQNPSGSVWSFTGQAGLTKNGTSYTSGNPNAPSGSQVLYLENSGYVETSFYFPYSGYYRFKFKAAWRQNAALKTKYIRIKVGTEEVGEIEIKSQLYDQYYTLPIQLTSGWKTIRIEGDNPNNPGSYMGFVDDFRIEQLPVLVNYPLMTVQPGTAYVIGTSNYNFNQLKVRGTLVAPVNHDVNITAKFILVEDDGRFQIGQERSPYEEEATITLTGTNPADTPLGTKVLGAMDNGVIELHGKEKISWTKLRESIGPNHAQPWKLKVAEPVDWKAGDEIVIAPSRAPSDSVDTGFAHQYEKKTIQYIPYGNQDLILSSNVQYHHSALTGYWNGNGQSWYLDQRAEVGLLTRNIKVQGDAASETSKMGAHIVVAGHNADGFISGVELYRMGQNQVIGKYPFHWHHGHDATGEFFKNSSIHRSYNRGLTIHRTYNTVVEDNVIFDHIGHGIFLEEGNEEGHEIRGNLVIGTKKPIPGEEMSDRADDGETLDEIQNRGPAAFWITHPNNIIEDNVAAGTVGTGFWYIFPRWDTGNQNKETQKAPFGSFKNNVAHSTNNGFDMFDELGVWDWTVNPAVFYPHSVNKNIGYLSTSDYYVENCTWYANRVGIYTGTGQNLHYRDETYREIYAPDKNLIFKNNIFADNEKAIMPASNNIIENTVFIDDTGSGNAPSVGRQSLLHAYDGGGQIRNSHISGFNSHTKHMMSLAGAEFPFGNFRFTNTTRANPVQFRISTAHHEQEGRRNIMIYDEDGSIGGLANTTLVMETPFNTVGDEAAIPGWTNFVRSTQNRRYVNTRLRVHYFYQPHWNWAPDVNVVREESGVTVATMSYQQDTPTLPFIMNDPNRIYIYDWQYTGNDDITDVMYTGPDTEINGQMFDRRVLQFKLANTVEAGDFVIVRFDDMSHLPGVYVDRSSDPRVNSLGSSATALTMLVKNNLNDLKNSNFSAYYDDGNHIYIKAIANGDFSQYFTFHWDPVTGGGGGTANNSFGLEGEKMSEPSQMVYPNPATDKLYIKGVENGEEVQVVDITGKLMQTSTYNSYLDISQIKSGMYVVRTQNGNHKFKKQ